MSSPLNRACEWLEADGLGGFSSGTALLERTRRYHAVLLAATTPPTGRVVLVNGFDAEIVTPEGVFPLTTQRYAPGVAHPEGARRIESFEHQPWPRWMYQLPNGVRLEHSLFVPRGRAACVLSWKLLRRQTGVMLRVRPFLSGRDYHSLLRAHDGFGFKAEVGLNHVRWWPNAALPAVDSYSLAHYTHKPDWYRNFLYADETARGLDDLEDLGSPGVLEWDLSDGEVVWVLAAEGHAPKELVEGGSPIAWAHEQGLAEMRRRRRFPTPLDRAADSYLVRRGEGCTIVAGYPWFTDWGRDTFIALRGLCLASGRLGDARDILVEWSGAVSEGMLPNRFGDEGDRPEYNSVDASLWYVVAVAEYLRELKRLRKRVSAADRKAMMGAVEAILDGYSRGTRYQIRMDSDGLIAAGEPGLQLTWMDAKADDWVVTPRIGKPVEIQALWLNALDFARGNRKSWEKTFQKALTSFNERFWNASRGMLFDVVDVDHVPGAVDEAFRPNQLFATGGLPLAPLGDSRARAVVDACEAHLWTPLGPRSLAPGEKDYHPRYIGDRRQRDGAYHQGTVWPWLSGAFVESWVRVRGGAPEVKAEARRRFLEPLLASMKTAGLGHITEVADAETPFTPRGCPFQAWSVGEVLRLDRVVLREG